MNNEFLKMQKLAGLITEGQYKEKLTENKTLFIPSEIFDGDQIYVIEYNGEKFEFSYQKYDDAYICLEPWGNNVAQLFKYLKSEGVKAIIDVAPEKTIIIKKDEFEKFI